MSTNMRWARKKSGSEKSRARKVSNRARQPARGPNNRYGTFPSIALAWKINQETFMKTLPVFSDLSTQVWPVL